MPLRARVGRHANTGANCQNWVGDQQAVIALLNLIPAADAGAEASIAGRIVAGVASDALYKAILAFQRKHFPAQVTGFIEPTGPMLALLETLALRPQPEPKPPSQWGEFKSGSVPRALRQGLSDDGYLNHVEVVEILRSTIANGRMSKNELDDLKMIAGKSKSMMPRSKKMLDTLAFEVNLKVGGNGEFNLSSIGQSYGAKLVCDFMRKEGSGSWPKLDRDEVGIGILLRLANPGLLRQGEGSLCGPAALLFHVLLSRPAQYAKFAIDLYEKGEATLNKLSIKPKGKIFSFQPPPTPPPSRSPYTGQMVQPLRPIDPVDWLTMASIRDSENWFFDYDTVGREFAGITTPMELALWFDRAGYYDVREDANFLAHKRGMDEIDEINRLIAAGYVVCLLLGGEMLRAAEQKTSATLPNHWVVLRTRIEISGGNVTMTIFTWGDGQYKVPESGTLPMSEFRMNFYGYVAARR